jgi:lipoprotein-anchoring transpeptidase ErfK/SrfK
MSAGTGRAGVVIRVSQQRLYVHDGYRGWTWFKVSTGARYGTPRGWSRVVSKQMYPSWRYQGAFVPGGVPANPLGVCWLGLGMPPGWRGAPVGLHGTNTPWVIGRPVTHGCVRLHNADALRLYRMVPLGTPVWILP